MNQYFKVGAILPSRKFTATNVSLFLYNAAVWNAHRIHYDENYTISCENHAGIVIDGAAGRGPLSGPSPSPDGPYKNKKNEKNKEKRLKKPLEKGMKTAL